uniref:Plexin-B2-like n=1 Tax=Echeneis naucrates TaxID=173247 RepID=A0A665UTT9_ECHNA
MERWWAWQLTLVALAAINLSPSHSQTAEFLSDTLINNVVVHPRTGRLYIGAVNALYQLNPDLKVESHTETGPKRDNRQCTPPVTEACEEARDTDNHNKLLLVHEAKDVLVVCGSVFRGICSLRNLSNVEQLLYFSDTKGEKSYVASAEEADTTHTETASFVGKGYGSHDSTKLISTRILQDSGDWVVFDSIIEASAVQANPFFLRYLHDFRFAFKDGGFMYFLFSRTLGVQDTKNFTFISRMCEDDQGYYSYTELQLNCSATNKYNKAQAAYVAAPGEALAQSLTASGRYGPVSASDKVLFVTFTSDEDPSTSALCRCHLRHNISIEFDRETRRNACYSNNGIMNGKPAVYSPYSSKSEELYKCGAEFLPSPMASKAEFALTSEASLVRKGHMTAVAVAVEMGHAVAFLGTAAGEVLKVHLSANPEVYGRAPGDVTGDKVNKNLLFDAGLRHLYVTTEKKITKVPVQACHLKTDCHACVSMKDPYCGWCVLEGKCTRKQECSRSTEENAWLWSPNQQCVQIQAFDPPNLSCRKTQQVRREVDISIPALPRLRQSDSLRCVFDNLRSIRLVEVLPVRLNSGNISESQILCVCADYVSVPVKILVNNKTEVTSGEYHFYNCAATVRKNQNTPCIACVTSEWGCQWNAQDHRCSDSDGSVNGDHISERCPQFESPDPLLIPVGFETPISFQGRNLDIYAVSVVLYNCSVGREDCSLCKHADAKYQCVWCAASRTCVYRELCHSPQPTQCPNPEITDIIPRFGPLNGNISVTIKGSNMGIKKEDIKRITVAGVESVQVEVEGGRSGTSEVIFTYQDPKPKSVEPLKGPAAGGTVITIRGNDLDTATKDDVTVRVGKFSCQVLSFGREITCKTGKYSGQKVPSDLLTVTVQYGKSTNKDIPAAFQYSDNPKITDYYPKASFSGLCPSQFVQESLSKNDTVLQFYSPSLNATQDTQSLRTVLQLDNIEEDLKDFDYHPNPSFNELAKNVITETSIIIVTVSAGRLRSSLPVRSLSPSAVTFTLCCLSARVEVKFGHGEWLVGSVYYARKDDIPLAIIIPAVLVPMLLFIAVSVYCYRRKSQQAEREYEKVKHQLENLEESVRDRCKKEFTDLMIEMEDHTSDLSEARIPFLDYKTYTDRNFFLPSKEGGANDTMITGRIQIPEARRMIVPQALNQFSNLLNSKTFLINFIHTLESRPDFNARARGDFASLLTVALHGKLEYYTDIMRTLLLELMEEHVQSKNPKLMLRRSETVVERMLCNWMSICLYQFLRDTAGEPLYKLFKALKHQVEKGPVDAKMKKAKYTLNDTGLLGDDVEYSVLVSVLVHGEGPDVTPVKVLNCDTISQVKEKIIDQVYRNLPYSQRPKVESVALEWRPGSTGQILSDLDLTSQKEGRWKRLNTLAHYNVRDNATLVLSRVLHTQSFHQHQDNHEEKNALLEDDNTFHLVRPADEIDEVKSKRGSMKDKAMTKAITEIYLTRLLSVKGTLQQFVDDFFRSVLCSSSVVPPAVKYFFDFLDEQALRHDNVDEETLHIWKTNSLPLRFWVNILRNPHFVFDVHVTEVVDASLHVISQTFMDACTKTEHKLSRESPSNKLLYAKEISTYKKMVDDYYKGIRQMVPVSDQDMNTHLAEVSRQHTDKLNTQVALHQLYKYASKYYDVIIQSLDEDPAAQNKQLTLRLQQIAAALENKVTDL